MRNYVLLNYDYLFNDHMAKCSHQAKLYYIKLMFFANNGFVSNPLEVLDSLGFDKGVFMELVANDEILTLPGREEIFITAYFIHTKFNPASWLSSPYAIYWKGKLRTKPNGVATFTPPTPKPTPDPVEQFDVPGRVVESSDSEWDNILNEIDAPR